MDCRSSAASFFNFLGALTRTLRATCTSHRCTLALGNSSLSTLSSPGNPSIIPKVAFAPSSPRRFRSSKNSRQLDADSLLPACKPNTIRWPLSVTPMATSTGTLSIVPSILMGNVTPSTNMHLNDSSDKSRCLHCSTASVSSLLALLISLEDIFSLQVGYLQNKSKFQPLKLAQTWVRVPLQAVICERKLKMIKISPNDFNKSKSFGFSYKILTNS